LEGKQGLARPRRRRPHPGVRCEDAHDVVAEGGREAQVLTKEADFQDGPETEDESERERRRERLTMLLGDHRLRESIVFDAILPYLAAADATGFLSW
jgi:hypothetical protein